MNLGARRQEHHVPSKSGPGLRLDPVLSRAGDCSGLWMLGRPPLGVKRAPGLP